MLLKINTASVETPALVRIAGAWERARAWYARKMKPNVSIRKSFGRDDFEAGTAAYDTGSRVIAVRLNRVEVWRFSNG